MCVRHPGACWLDHGWRGARLRLQLELACREVAAQACTTLRQMVANPQHATYFWQRSLQPGLLLAARLHLRLASAAGPQQVIMSPLC